MRRALRLCGTLVLGVACALAGGSALGQSFPNKPVRIFASSVGSTSDSTARFLGHHLGLRWNIPVIVENRGGAGATLAATPVASSPPDGYTLLLGESSSLAISPNLYKKVEYDPVKSFAPITLVAKAPLVVVANSAFPVANLRELVAYAKANPGKVTYSSGGNGTASHLTTALLSHLTKIELLHVPYKGPAPALMALIAGDVNIACIAASSAMGQIKAGKVKALAVTSPTRFAGLPDIPTGAEAGIEGFESEVWFGVVAPARTPTEVLDLINADIGRVLRSDAARATLLAQGALASPSSRDEFLRHIQTENEKWSRVIKATGARGD